MLFSEEEDGGAEVSRVQFQMFWRRHDENPPDDESRRPEEDESLSELFIFLHQRLGGNNNSDTNQPDWSSSNLTSLYRWTSIAAPGVTK